MPPSSPGILPSWLRQQQCGKSRPMGWEMESQAHPLPLGGRVLSIAHRGLSTELAVIRRPNLSRNQPRCPNVRELANSLPVQGREYVRNAPQAPRVALDRPTDATRQDGSID